MYIVQYTSVAFKIFKIFTTRWQYNLSLKINNCHQLTQLCPLRNGCEGSTSQYCETLLSNAQSTILASLLQSYCLVTCLNFVMSQRMNFQMSSLFTVHLFFCIIFLLLPCLSASESTELKLSRANMLELANIKHQVANRKVLQMTFVGLVMMQTKGSSWYFATPEARGEPILWVIRSRSRQNDSAIEYKLVWKIVEPPNSKSSDKQICFQIPNNKIRPYWYDCNNKCSI